MGIVESGPVQRRHDTLERIPLAQADSFFARHPGLLSQFGATQVQARSLRGRTTSAACPVTGAGLAGVTSKKWEGTKNGKARGLYLPQYWADESGGCRRSIRVRDFWIARDIRLPNWLAAARAILPFQPE